MAWGMILFAMGIKGLVFRDLEKKTPLPSVAMPGHGGHSKSIEGALLMGRLSLGENKGLSGGQLMDALVSGVRNDTVYDGNKRLRIQGFEKVKRRRRCQAWPCLAM